jgi:hypothetical protein
MIAAVAGVAAVLAACSPAALSDADQLGLRLLVDALGLPDSWEPCLALKGLALSSCWHLAHADQVKPLNHYAFQGKWGAAASTRL